MGILSEHLENHCDHRMSGILSLGIREAYRYTDDLFTREKILQRPEMNKVKGYVRNGFVDVAIKQVMESSNIPHEIADKSSSKYRNGHTYLMIETKGSILTPAKVQSRSSVPRKAIYRSRGSLLNKQYSLWHNPEDLNNKYDEINPPFLLLTYGGLNHRLSFVRLGLPDVESESWIDQVDIMNSPVLLSNSESDDVNHGLELTFTAEAENIIKRGLDHEREEGL